MKKNILFIVLSAFTLFQMKAIELPQDSISGKDWYFNINIDEIKDRTGEWNIQIDIDTSMFRNWSHSFDTTQLMAMQENLKMQMNNMSKSFENWASVEKLDDLSESMKELSKNIKPIQFNFQFNNAGVDQDRNPDRIEKKTFQNISEVEFFQKYGDIIVRESNGKDIQLEIQYFNEKDSKKENEAICNISVTNKLLSIETSNSGKGNRGAKINYIISIPNNIALNVDLKYGNIKIDKLNGRLSTNLSYSNLSVKEISEQKTSIKAKYSDIKIDQAKDLDFSTSYSDIHVTKAASVEISGNYNDYVFSDIQSLSTKQSISYGDIKIGNVASINADVKYIDISIDNLISTMNTTTAYGDINIKDVSTKLKNIDIKASYADVSLGLPPGVSVGFDFNLNYGDFSLSKKYEVQYTESSDRNNRVVRKGQIGKGSPTATIQISNNYADIKIL
ncbi:MAG: DUF4097 domain-containing protein [Prevotella sp.]|jgi:hypothetical protein|nr:DUF4097 domain-containing protein [Prevotella sp.]